MPTDLRKLKVSLTKHGAHKVAYLIEAFPPEEIIHHIHGDYHDINIETVQTRTNLSISQNGDVPNIWYEIKKYKREDIFDLTFLAIVFSHHELIETMRVAFKQECKVKRGDVITGKAYSNFAHTLDELKYSIHHTSAFITFDISRIYYKFYLIPLIRSLLVIKLVEAGWQQNNSLEEECLNLRLNEAIGFDQETFLDWIKESSEDIIIPTSKAKRNFREGLNFSEGHNQKMEDDLIVIPKSKMQRVTLLHNKIQNHLYEVLKNLYQDNQIGTEIYSNGGSIDIVRKVDKNSFVFYEIKTSDSARSNIRQAIPQLLEYAYWKPKMHVEKMIIVGPVELDKDSESYIQYLRQNFNLTFFYQSFDLETDILSEEK